MTKLLLELFTSTLLDLKDLIDEKISQDLKTT